MTHLNLLDLDFSKMNSTTIFSIVLLAVLVLLLVVLVVVTIKVLSRNGREGDEYTEKKYTTRKKKGSRGSDGDASENYDDDDDDDDEDDEDEESEDGEPEESESEESESEESESDESESDESESDESESDESEESESEESEELGSEAGFSDDPEYAGSELRDGQNADQDYEDPEEYGEEEEYYNSERESNEYGSSMRAESAEAGYDVTDEEDADADTEYEGAEYESAEYESAEYEGAEYEGAEYEGTEYEGTEYEGTEYEGTEYEEAEPEGYEYAGSDDEEDGERRIDANDDVESVVEAALQAKAKAAELEARIAWEKALAAAEEAEAAAKKASEAEAEARAAGANRRRPAGKAKREPVQQEVEGGSQSAVSEEIPEQITEQITEQISEQIPEELQETVSEVTDATIPAPHSGDVSEASPDPEAMKAATRVVDSEQIIEGVKRARGRGEYPESRSGAETAEVSGAAPVYGAAEDSAFAGTAFVNPQETEQKKQFDTTFDSAFTDPQLHQELEEKRRAARQEQTSEEKPEEITEAAPAEQIPLDENGEPLVDSAFGAQEEVEEEQIPSLQVARETITVNPVNQVNIRTVNSVEPVNTTNEGAGIHDMSEMSDFLSEHPVPKKEKKKMKKRDMIFAKKFDADAPRIRGAKYLWYNNQDIEALTKKEDMYYYCHYFNDPRETILPLIIEMYDCAFVRTEEIQQIAYGIQYQSMGLREILTARENISFDRSKVQKDPSDEDKKRIRLKWCEYVNNFMQIIVIQAPEDIQQFIREQLYEYGNQDVDTLLFCPEPEEDEE